ncbi:nitrogenase (plasmid) [Methylosinus trichosporium OB3b]|uniref:Nitrogenase n=2 Tax=Methylocystaceae TaxID=31993 RepID=A0A2D2D7R1_METT3|nr:nitrogenase [Methylosinus trichosporium OB3b]OBS50670.1 nitrogenase [Methylosinus sp. 3S-1]
MLNPFLPKKQKGLPIRWRTGPSAGKVGLSSAEFSAPPVAEARVVTDPSPYRKDPRGRKPKSEGPKPRERAASDLFPAQIARSPSEAGRLKNCSGHFLAESNSGWGANLDMLSLAHGPVGCGVFSQAGRFTSPGFTQGVDGFTALHACTNLGGDDLPDGGDEKLARALDEAATLFPLARGVTILNEDPILFLDANVKGVAKTKAKELDRLITPLACEAARSAPPYIVDTAWALRGAASRVRAEPRSRDVAITFFREAVGLVWIVSKLLRDIGLQPVHALTGSSTSDMARVSACKLIIGFSLGREPSPDHLVGGYAHLLHKWFGAPIQWTCFAGPSATDASLRKLAVCFGPRVAARAERVVAENRSLVEAIVSRYRPRLEGKLLIHFEPMTDDQLEPFRLLGMRIGDVTGWEGKTGKRRTPRRVCDGERPSLEAIEAYIVEAAPDLVLGLDRDEFDWRKRGRAALPFSSLFDRKGNAFWGYDGFACLAAELDRCLNAPWRGLVEPPWSKSIPISKTPSSGAR